MNKRHAYAVIASDDRAATARTVSRYLPTNYWIDAAWTLDGVTLHGVAVLIAGRDSAGWTLDEYVIPRMRSGLLPFVEITADEAERLNPYPADAGDADYPDDTLDWLER